MKRFFHMMVICLSFIITGCATLADAKAAKGSGTFKVYDKEYNVVWEATIDSIKELGLDLVSDSKDNGTILAQRGMTAFSYGENVAVFVEAVNGQVKTRVEVVNKRALATNITAANWEHRIFSKLDEKLTK